MVRTGRFVGSWFILPETNSEFAPENGWLEYDPFLLGQTAYFQGRTVSFREGILLEQKIRKESRMIDGD